MARKDDTTLSICTRCRPVGETMDDEQRPGYRLAQAVHSRFSNSQAAKCGVALRGVKCMSQCKRHCVIGLSGSGKFTLLFGDLNPQYDAVAILQLAAEYAEQSDGLVQRADRPEALRASILGRVPPIGHDDLVDPDFTISSKTKITEEIYR